MIIFDGSMFMSNFIQEALDEFDKILITKETFDTLVKASLDDDIIRSKKGKKAINLIYKYYEKKIYITSFSMSALLNTKDKDTIYTADKSNIIYFNYQKNSGCPSEIKLFKPKQSFDRFFIYSDPDIITNNEYNPLNLKINDYFIYHDNTDHEEYLYKVNEDLAYIRVPYQTFKSNEMGEIKPKKNDLYQLAAIDSLTNNQITMLKGQAGTGKSYLAMGALFAKLRKHEIDKIYIFCNPVATRDSAKLGFYPGDKNSKLLDSQIGNFLDGKIGDRIGVERLINENKIILLPMSDIRGFDTNGKKAGIYITEAQNMTIDLMQLALERVGEDCICIIDGDYHKQVDLDIYADINSGMRRASEVFKGSNIYGEVCLQNIYRSKIAALAALMTNDN